MDFPKGLLTMVTGWKTFCTSEDYRNQILLTWTSDGCRVGQQGRGERIDRGIFPSHAASINDDNYMFL
jgi:hypothetical protein